MVLPVCRDGVRQAARMPAGARWNPEFSPQSPTRCVPRPRGARPRAMAVTPTTMRAEFSSRRSPSWGQPALRCPRNGKAAAATAVQRSATRPAGLHPPDAWAESHRRRRMTGKPLRPAPASRGTLAGRPAKATNGVVMCRVCLDEPEFPVSIRRFGVMGISGLGGGTRNPGSLPAAGERRR
jgi:hypothetical protein